MTDSNYDFAQLGEGIAQHLIRAAEEQVAKAQMALDQSRSLAEIIRNQAKAQVEQIEEMDARFRAFGEQMLAAHRLLAGAAPPPAVADQRSPAADPAGDDGGAAAADRHPNGHDGRDRAAKAAPDIDVLRALATGGQQPADVSAPNHGRTGSGRTNGSGAL